MAVTDGWAHHIFRAFEIRFFGKGTIKGEVRNDRFDPRLNAMSTGISDHLQGLATACMNDVNMRPGELGEGHEVMTSLHLDLDGTGGFMPLGAEFSLFDKLSLALGNEVGIFTMGRHDHTELTGEFESLIQLFIVDSKGPLVGEEDLEGGNALLLNKTTQGISIPILKPRYTEMK